MLLISDWVQTNVRRLHSMNGNCEIWILRKTSPLQAEVEPKMYLILQVKCPQLVTDHNQNGKVNIVREESARYEFSGKFLKQKPR